MLIKGQRRLSNINGSLLLIQLGDIGDVVLSLPALRALKRHFKDTPVWMCVREKVRGLLEDVPELAGVLSVDETRRSLPAAVGYQWKWIRNLRRRQLGLVLDLRTGSRGTFIAILSGAAIRIGRLDHGKQRLRRRCFTHLVRPDPDSEKDRYATVHHLHLLTGVGIPAPEALQRLRVPPEKTVRIESLLRREGVPPDQSRIAVSPFSLWSYKEWPEAAWIRLMAHLSQHLKLRVLIIGSSEERRRGEALVRAFPEGISNLAGKTLIGELPALLQSCRLFIGVDSGPLHVAAAVGTPTVSLFGPSPAAIWAPRGKEHRVVSKTWPCIPCREKGCQGSGISRCMDAITVNEVLDAVHRQIQRIGSEVRTGEEPA